MVKKCAIIFGCLGLFLFFAVPVPVSAQACTCPVKGSGFSDNSCPAAACASLPGSTCIVSNTTTGAGTCQVGIPTGTAGTTTQVFAAPTAMTTFSDFLCNIIDFINNKFLPPIAVFMTLLAGFFFMLSGQDPQKATLAKRILLYTVIGIALFLVAPGIVALIANILGATGAFSPVSCSSSMGADTVTAVLMKLVNWFAWFISVASVAMGLYAGFLYLTSRGDPRQTQQAAKTLSYTIIGIAVSVIAFSIVSLVKAFIE